MTATTTDGGRTETKRFTTDSAPFTAADFIVRDRIEPALVARVMDGLGERRSADPDAAPTQLAEATITDRHDDVHRAILVDGETGVLVRASRHDSQSAWSQKEADWKVRELGEKVTVESAEIAQDGNDEWGGADAAADDAEAWANVVLQERAQGATDYDDELSLTGSGTLRLRDPYGPTKVYATVELKDT